MNKVEGKVQLCWNCAKATGFCSWSREFRPVNGWVAKDVRLKMTLPTGTKYIKTFHILFCPEFEYDGMCSRCDLCPDSERKNENYADMCPEFRSNHTSCMNFTYRGVQSWDILLD